ncbi:MAG: hypothetical protein Kow0069_38200 [Promethearchaeota archaeon]
MSGDLFDEEMFRDSVFKDAKTLDGSFVPEKLPRRKEEVRRLIQDFRPLVQSEENMATMSVNVLITGKGGVGKTATARYFADNFSRKARNSGYRVLWKYFNCLEFRTKSSIYRSLLSDYCLQTGKGYSDDETVLQLRSYLERNRSHALLVLDEVHVLSTQDVQSLVNLGETLGEEGSARISTILVSRQSDWERVRSQRIDGRMVDHVYFKPYSWDDLYEILSYRRDLAFKSGALEDDVLSFVVDVASETADARHGIQLMLQAGKFADSEGASQVTGEMVRSVKDRVYSTFRADVLNQFKYHELLAALGVARRLRFTDEPFVLVEDCYEDYVVACEERNEKPHTVTSFRKYLRNLARFKVVLTETVQVEKSKRGRHSRITVEDIPAAKLEELLEKLLYSRQGEREEGE